jgi:hypothetical protein
MRHLAAVGKGTFFKRRGRLYNMDSAEAETGRQHRLIM